MPMIIRMVLGSEAHPARLARSTVSVLIVNYRTPTLTMNAVASALRQPDVIEVIIVDNASNDKSAEVLAELLERETRAKVLSSAANLGFGGGNNHAARSAKGELLFLLNSDASCNDGTIEALVDYQQRHPEAVVVAPRVNVGHGTKMQADSFGRFPNAWNTLTRRSTNLGASCTEPDWVSGCGFMISREAYERFGGFDTRFFMYFEDVHLCWRIRRAGGDIHRCTATAIQHLGGQSYRSKSGHRKDYVDAHNLFLEVSGVPFVARRFIRGMRRITKSAQELLPLGGGR
jgi:N-acetylglucosaminyl-diphospho-decaprenol L-rhamnosyltransferase